MKIAFAIFRSIIYVPLFILLFWWIAQGVRVFDPEIGIVLPLWTRPIGLIFMIAGAILAIICIAVFISVGKGTPAPFDPPREFVARGPYAYVRNPMYIGGLILLTGFGLYQYSLSIVILTVLLLGVVHLLVVLVEEPILEKQFGENYHEYKRHIHRWIPRLIKNKIHNEA
jgi:protein-S-isoprenylcysteine O-methyltransferase Ste14